MSARRIRPWPCLMACGVKPFLKTGGTTRQVGSVRWFSFRLRGYFLRRRCGDEESASLMIMALYLLYLAAVPAKLILPHWRNFAAVAAALAALLLTDAVVVQSGT